MSKSTQQWFPDLLLDQIALNKAVNGGVLGSIAEHAGRCTEDVLFFVIVVDCLEHCGLDVDELEEPWYCRSDCCN